MRKIQFDTVCGVREVEEFDDDIDFLGCFSDHNASPEFLTYFREPFDGVRGMEIGDKVFDLLDAEYGVHSIL